LLQPSQFRPQRQQAVDQLTVFARMHGAGGIHQLPARPQQRQQPLQQLPLQRHQSLDRRWIHAPARIGMAGQGAQARAGGIHEDAIEAAAQLRCIQRQPAGIAVAGFNAGQTQAGAVALHPPQTRLAPIQRQHQALIVHRLGQVRALAARGGAGIEDPLPRLGIQQGCHPLGGSVLHAPVPLVVTGQLA